MVAKIHHPKRDNQLIDPIVEELTLTRTSTSAQRLVGIHHGIFDRDGHWHLSWKLTFIQARWSNEEGQR